MFKVDSLENEASSKKMLYQIFFLFLPDESLPIRLYYDYHATLYVYMCIYMYICICTCTYIYKIIEILTFFSRERLICDPWFL